LYEIWKVKIKINKKKDINGQIVSVITLLIIVGLVPIRRGTKDVINYKTDRLRIYYNDDNNNNNDERAEFFSSARIINYIWKNVECHERGDMRIQRIFVSKTHLNGSRCWFKTSGTNVFRGTRDPNALTDTSAHIIYNATSGTDSSTDSIRKTAFACSPKKKI